MRKKKFEALTEEQRSIVEANIPLVTMIISKYCRSLPLEWNEMLSAGYFALCRAVGIYDESKGCTFSTYAAKAILNQVKHDAHYFVNETRKNNVQHMSLNSEVPLDNNIDRTEFIDFLIDKSANVQGEVENRLLCDKIKEYAPTLSELTLRDMKLEDLASEQGVSKQRISAKKISETRRIRRMLTHEVDWLPFESQNGATVQIGI